MVRLLFMVFGLGKWGHEGDIPKLSIIFLGAPNEYFIHPLEEFYNMLLNFHNICAKFSNQHPG